MLCAEVMPTTPPCAFYCRAAVGLSSAPTPPPYPAPGPPLPGLSPPPPFQARLPVGLADVHVKISHDEDRHLTYLTGQFQGVRMRSKGDPVLYINSPDGVTSKRQHDVIQTVQRLNEIGNQTLADPELETRINQYEMAFRMQMSVPGLVDFSDEPEHILNLYGTKGADGTFAANCLLARRLAERGVRFVQLYHRGWDHHGNIKQGIGHTAKLVDQASAALVLDLKQRGLLEDTLIVWGGEFGRTPMAQGSGRDHHIKAFSIWMAGGGIRPGFTFGATDDLGYHAVEDVVDVHDFHATMLQLLGINHEGFTYRYQGRDFRLTDVHGSIIKEIIA